MHAFPKASLMLQKMIGTKVSTQWLSFSANSTFGLKSYVKTLLFNIFKTLHLGKGHIQASTGILALTPATASYT